MTRINGPGTYWRTYIILAGIAAAVLYFVVVKPLAGVMGWVLP